MAGRSSQTKGKRGRLAARKLLEERGWQVDPTLDGIVSDDLVVIDPAQKRWSVEVKNQKIIDHYRWIDQAVSQGMRRKLPWMLMVWLHGYSRAWLVFRRGYDPEVWLKNNGA